MPWPTLHAISTNRRICTSSHPLLFHHKFAVNLITEGRSHLLQTFRGGSGKTVAMAGKMWCLLLLCVAAVAVDGRTIAQEGGSACKNLNVKKLSFMSPPLTAKPGQANNKYYAAEFPKGHIGIKVFTAELVDEKGVSIPLSELYLHHWVMLEFAVPKEKAQRHLGHLLHHMGKHHNHKHGMHRYNPTAAFEAPHHLHEDHLHEDHLHEHHFHEHHLHEDHLHEDHLHEHHHGRFHGGHKQFRTFLGKGGETRHTDSRTPGPYVKESGIPTEGYETVWVLNVHALDTRGVVSPIGCAECRCALYNATKDEDGSPLPEGYLGGLRCCGDGNMCALKEGTNAEERTFYLKYTWEYIDWNECLVPLKSVGIDITNHDGYDENLVEFTVDGCGDADPNSEECVDLREATLISPIGGEVVYTVSHLHAATLDAAIYGEDGRLICRTTPIYGQGNEAGNEKNYVVGIKNCVHTPGSPNSMRVKQGEKLRYVVKSTKVGGPHTGLMALVGVQLVPDGVSAVI